MRFDAGRLHRSAIASRRSRRRIWPLVAIIIGLIIAIWAAHLYFFRLPRRTAPILRAAAQCTSLAIVNLHRRACARAGGAPPVPRCAPAARMEA
jgi:hypothetical protein